MKVNPEHQEMLKKQLLKVPFLIYLGIEPVKVEPKEAVFEMKIKEEHHQIFGTAHGGVVSSLIDTAAYWSLYYDLKDDSSSLISVDLRLNFLAPLIEGNCVAQAKQVKLGRTLGLSEVRVVDKKEKLVAHGTSTLMVLQNQRIQFYDQMPRKFL